MSIYRQSICHIDISNRANQVVGEQEEEGGGAEVLDGGTDLEMVEAPADEPGTRAKGSVSLPPLAQNLCNPGNSRLGGGQGGFNNTSASSSFTFRR